MTYVDEHSVIRAVQAGLFDDIIYGLWSAVDNRVKTIRPAESALQVFIYDPLPSEHKGD